MTMAVREEPGKRQPWMQTRTALIVFFVGLVLWSAVSLLFYFEVP